MVGGKKTNIALLFGFGFLLMGLWIYACGSKSENPVIGRQAPNFTYLGLDVQTGELKDLKGKVVILRFWAD